MREINAETGLYCVFGNPVSHSLSPVMHNAAFSELGINAVYLAFRPESAADALSAMRSLNISGASVTLPFKTDVLEFLDETDSLSRDIGAVNTLLNDNGRLRGFNTDGQGAILALLGEGADPSGSSLILGNGGSARAIAFSLLSAGGSVTVAGRNPERYQPLVRDLRARDTRVKGMLLSEIDESAIEEIDIIINTTTVGMAPGESVSPLPEKLIMPRHTVFDIVYSPHRTALIEGALKRGCRVVYGRDMLLYQGATAV